MIQIYTTWQESTDALDRVINKKLATIPQENVIDVKFSVSSHEAEGEYENRINDYMCAAMILYRDNTTSTPDPKPTESDGEGCS